MSCFIVEDKTINRIVSFCFWCNGEDYLKHEIRRELKVVNIDLNKYFKDDNELDNYLKCFGEELLKLNLMAFYSRYKDSEKISEEIKQEIREAIENYKYFDLPLKDRSILQVLKSIECLLYQCSEGNIPEEPLFKVLEKITGHLKSHIINEIPEYNKAVWG